MTTENREDKLVRLGQLEEQVRQLQAELSTQDAPAWKPQGYYTAYYATTGFMLGGIAAAASLLFNIIGSLMVGQHALQLIKVYLTFPLGERALSPDLDSGLVLAVGCCLYLATGMLLGVPTYLLLSKLTQGATLSRRLVVATVIGVAIWLINFYGLLSWLQPVLFGGNWILTQIPIYVALLTHLVFTWTLALLYPLGQYRPYYSPNLKSTTKSEPT